jgi:DNA-binding transcriptional ArsR family regulator
MNIMAKQKYNYAPQAKLFKALMHPTRLAILDVLRPGEACVCHMEAALGHRQAYLSQQLMVLREAGLVDDRRDGWNVYYHVANPGIWGVLDAARAMLGEKPVQEATTRVIASCTCPHCTQDETSRLSVSAQAR